MPKIEAQIHQIIKDLETTPCGFKGPEKNTGVPKWENELFKKKNLTITRSTLKTIIYNHRFIGPIWPDSIKKMSARTKIGGMFITSSLYQ